MSEWKYQRSPAEGSSATAFEHQEGFIDFMQGDDLASNKFKL